MTPYNPADTFDVVQEYDITDQVKGGDAGESNQPVKQLANRTQYLYNRLGGYIDVMEISGDTLLDSGDANKLISVSGGTNVNISIAALAHFTPGNRLAFVAGMNTAGGPFWVNINVVGTSGDRISDAGVLLTSIYFYSGEMVEIVAGPTNWKLTIAKGNFDKIGQDDLKRIQPRNSFIADGTGGDTRMQYPRLWPLVSSMAVDDASWFSSPFRYRSLFSTGNGTTTFRRPDMRAMSHKALDLTRGVSLGRLDERPGGFEADNIKAHTHPIKRTRTDTIGQAYEGNTLRNGGDRALWTGDDIVTGSTGGAENTVKSIGFLPIIYY